MVEPRSNSANQNEAWPYPVTQPQQASEISLVKPLPKLQPVNPLVTDEPCAVPVTYYQQGGEPSPPLKIDHPPASFWQVSPSGFAQIAWQSDESKLATDEVADFSATSGETSGANGQKVSFHQSNPAGTTSAIPLLGRQPSVPAELPPGPPEPPRSIAGDSATPVEGLPIDLGTALQLTAGQNPQVAFAQQRVQEAFARLDAAEVLWLPSIRAGANYNKHEGRIQDVAGKMIETSRGSLYNGFGAGAVGAGSPAVPGLIMNFELRDAIFQPRIAERTVAARRQASRAVTNDMLMDTSLAYVELLEALQARVIAGETLMHAQRLAELTAAFARAGQGLQSDADRAATELNARQVDLRGADERIQVASVRLARLLSQDPSILLVPQEPALIPIDVVILDCELPELVSQGLRNRPELAEARFLVGEAVQALQRERYAPLMPSVLLGMSYGGNGGGLGGNIENYGDRMDFDAMAFWQVRNIGLGERAAKNEANARISQARSRQIQVMDQVAADIAEAHAQVIARRDQIGIAERGIESAAESYRRNLERIGDGQGLPIEALQAIQALDQARRQYLQAVADYNKAQFRLQRALGWPIRV